MYGDPGSDRRGVGPVRRMVEETEVLHKRALHSLGRVSFKQRALRACPHNDHAGVNLRYLGSFRALVDELVRYPVQPSFRIGCA